MSSATSKLSMAKYQRGLVTRARAIIREWFRAVGGVVQSILCVCPCAGGVRPLHACYMLVVRALVLVHRTCWGGTSLLLFVHLALIV